MNVSVQTIILNLLAKLNRELGFSCLFISHDWAVVRAVARQVAVVRVERVEVGSTGHVLTNSRPRHPY